MKASSVGLEVFVDISPEEFEELKSRGLEGAIRFRDNAGTPSRDIPFTITYDGEQIPMLSVRQTPAGTYFGESERIDFSINPYYYEELRTGKRMGERFHMGGKLVMVIQQH